VASLPATDAKEKGFIPNMSPPPSDTIGDVCPVSTGEVCPGILLGGLTLLLYLLLPKKSGSSISVKLLAILILH
jgi:hypothetical protein